MNSEQLKRLKLHALCSCSPEMEGDILSAIDLLSRLPRTHDGEIVIPQIDGVYHPDYPGLTMTPISLFEAVEEDSGGVDDVEVCQVSECFSTKEAAESSLKNK